METTSKLNLGSIKVSLSDIELGVTSSKFKLQSSSKAASEESNSGEERTVPRKRLQPYIKITLRKTADILLYEQCSLTELSDTEEGRQVTKDNTHYELLKAGKNSYFRRKRDAEVQTRGVLLKTRSVNTETIKKHQVGSYVSNFEMFDTYKDLLEQSTKSIEMDGREKIEVTTYRVRGVDAFLDINESASFKIALMLTMRLLASNVFEKQQRRFRNMEMPDPLALQVNYEYRLELLWHYAYPETQDNESKAVADISWCPSNGDILAVAYGIYAYSHVRPMPRDGYICIWNIKNPVNPERCFYYSVPVVSVEFSPYVPQLLAIGLYDGTIEVRDITHAEHAPVAISERNSSPGCEPVTAIKWLRVSEHDDNMSFNIAPFLALSQDGTVTKYRIINSPYLLGLQQIRLERTEGNPEGLSKPLLCAKFHVQANHHPQGLSLCLDPLANDIYYVLTDEGCLHKCSTNYPHQHLSVNQVHIAAVNTMEFSPWSPKLYLTCGNDWCVYIWLAGIFEPLITLQNGTGPMHCASWSKTHSTIIVSLNRCSINVWDLRRSTLKPVSSTTLEAGFYTLGKFSLCGRSIAVGNERGNVLMCALEDMPFPPHYQYDELENALLEALSNKPELLATFKSIGYFGNPQQKQKRRKQKTRTKQKINKMKAT